MTDQVRKPMTGYLERAGRHAGPLLGAGRRVRAGAFRPVPGPARPGTGLDGLAGPAAAHRAVPERGRVSGQPPHRGADRRLHRQSSASRRFGSFLDAIAEWGWPEAPARRLIFPRDAPKLPHPLPRYLPADQERALLAALENSPNRLRADALLLLRATGMRIGELTTLELDCVHEVPGSGAWLKVPLGKLLTERMVPIDDETVEIIDRITEHRYPAGRCAIPAPGRWLTSCSPTRPPSLGRRPSATNCTAPPPKPT